MQIINFIYRKILRPILFLIDAELVHDFFSNTGEFLGKYKVTRALTANLFGYQDPRLNKEILGITFTNPIGLPAGFDYKGKMVGIMQSVGYGFNTVGTVTAKYYEGNQKPRLKRLPKSQSLLVNKGFKSDGVDALLPKLNKAYLKAITFGVSVGSTNISAVDTIDKAIADYIYTFTKLETSPYIKYYELNISCPNTSMPESFTDPVNFEKLLVAVSALHFSRPVFVKMPNELEITKTDLLVQMAMKYQINAFIFANLVKDRNNPRFNKDEINMITKLKGNFSGKPAEINSVNLINYFRQKYKNDIVLVACGGVFTATDAKERLDAGADLVQVLTGMIYNGSGLISEINKFLSCLLDKKDPEPK